VNPAIYGALASQVYGSVADQVYDDVANHDASAVDTDAQANDPTALFEAARAKFFQQGQKVSLKIHSQFFPPPTKYTFNKCGLCENVLTDCCDLKGAGRATGGQEGGLHGHPGQRS